MKIQFTINHTEQTWEIVPGDTLLSALRQRGYFGVKFGGCQKGECGSCTVLLDGHPVNSCSMLAAQVDGREIQTIEGIGQHPDQGWRSILRGCI